MLPETYLGWDRSMKLLLCSKLEQGELKFAYSTDPACVVEDYGGTQYQTRWAIWVPQSQSSQDEMTGDWYLIGMTYISYVSSTEREMFLF